MEKISIPNLFIIGASKCATTSIWSILSQHPDVFMSKVKEPNYFCWDNYKEKYYWYLSLFEQSKNEKIIGEASPIYSESLTFPDIANKIHKFNPNSKIIYSVREPISRLQSVWRQTLYSGHWYKKVYLENFGLDLPVMPLSIEEAMHEYPPFLKACKYWSNLCNYIKLFGKENICLIFFEDFKSDPVNTYNTVCDFLNIEKKLVSRDSIIKIRNPSSQKKMIRPMFCKNKTNYLNSFERILPPIIFNNIKYKKIKLDGLFDPDFNNQLLALLSDEIELILKYGGKQITYWKN